MRLLAALLLLTTKLAVASVIDYGPPTDSGGNFLSGDIRVNESPEETSLQTLFVR